ncbi:kinase-like protein, partial [Melanomma pulvis-pyrius CBS 109.77]
MRSNNPFLPNFTAHLPLHGASSSSVSSSRAPVLGSRPTAQLERQKTLSDYFSIEEVPRRSYTDQEFADIARLINETGRESWSRIPRIYTVLRLIDQVVAIDAFLDLGMNDFWLPFHTSQLPKSLSAFYRERFIQSQNVVLTTSIDLENDRQKEHIRFKPGESFPFTVGDRLGAGGYASVDKVLSPWSGRTYARKRFRRTKVKPSDTQSFMNELKILKRINHHHCVELVASYTDSKYFGLLISPVADCDLLAYYSTVPNSGENMIILRSFFGCLARALQFLHDGKIRHRDLKPENILVKGNTVYLTDFGISLDWENLSRSTTTEDSAKSWIYCAPEVAQYDRRNSSSDIWSLGCVFMEMFTVLKGFTVEDLRKTFRENSGRTRFYENFDVAMDWLDKLNHHGEPTDNEVARWIRNMLVIDRSSRDTAQALFLSIITAGRENKSMQNTGLFCGRCCSDDHDIESSSEAASDDNTWARDV